MTDLIERLRAMRVGRDCVDVEPVQEAADALEAKDAENLRIRQSHNGLLEDLDAAQAKIERLTEELDNERARGIHSCHPECKRPLCVAQREIARLNQRHENFLQEFWATNAENQRLREALERVAQLHGGNFAVRDIAREALKQEDAAATKQNCTHAEDVRVCPFCDTAATKQEDEG